jgi:DNA-dependent RNA polymerase auxiliary subunit epsilon
VTATFKDGGQISSPLFQNTKEIRNLIMDYFRYFAIEEIEVLEDEDLEYEEF